MSLTKSDKKWLFGIACTLIAGLWKIWTFEIKSELIIPLIKLAYSLFLATAIGIAVYIIVFKKETKKHGKK